MTLYRAKFLALSILKYQWTLNIEKEIRISLTTLFANYVTLILRK